MKDPMHQRLEDAIARRDKATETVQRLQGRLAAALEDVAKVEKECLARGVPPDKLSLAIQQLERRYEDAVVTFERGISEAENKLAPFVEDPV